MRVPPVSVRIVTLMVALSLVVGCGRWEKNDSDEDDAAVAPSSDARPGLPGPRGPVGQPGARGPAGAKGPKGDRGNTGAGGAQGETGNTGGIGLFDAEGTMVGVKFQDGTNDVADVFLMDDHRALIDLATGELRAPADDAFCMYESANCSGACYAYDHRWLNVVLRDEAGQTWVAQNGTADSGPKTMRSYVDADGMCQAAMIGTLTSYEAEVYTPSTPFPLAAPLYWSLAQ